MLKARICNPIVFAKGVGVINELNGDGHNQTSITASEGQREVAKKFLQSLKNKKFPIKDEEAFIRHVVKDLEKRVEKTGQNNFSSPTTIVQLAALLDKSFHNFSVLKKQ